ncbi:MAG: aminoacyl-tRNA hydrolase [Clostridia bacterium]|nr:aminoacyl-tRNA hydrolase [Clostridia bacterium]
MANIFDLFKKIESERAPVMPITHILVGLGNPGKEYERTRHNAGFMALDLYCQKNGISVTRSKFNSLTAEADIGGKRVLIMKPQLYMNRSGEAVRDAANFYKIPPENIVVISDDVQLDIGKLRVRRKGSDGGQKGLRDIIYQLSSDAFPRIRIGVGKLPTGGNMVNWVLGKIPADLESEFNTALNNASDAIPLLIEGKIDEAMCKYN